MIAGLGSCHPTLPSVHIFGRRAIGPCLMLATAMAVSACGVTQDSATTKSRSAVPLPSSLATDTSASAAFDPLAAVGSYEGALDNLYLDAATPLDSFHAVAVTPDFLTETAAVAHFRQSNHRQLGRTSVVSAAVNRAGVGAAVGVNGSVQVHSCIDVHAVRGVDANGASIVATDRKPYLVAELTFVHIGSGTGSGWKVSQVHNTQASSCDG